MLCGSKCICMTGCIFSSINARNCRVYAHIIHIQWKITKKNWKELFNCVKWEMAYFLISRELTTAAEFNMTITWHLNRQILLDFCKIASYTESSVIWWSGEEISKKVYKCKAKRQIKWNTAESTILDKGKFWRHKCAKAKRKEVVMSGCFFPLLVTSYSTQVLGVNWEGN